uniref:Uncharacterized protein n=1 Tax=Arundo donax TaxID=35708 RepID=A0A0A9HW81_ARUDO
MIRLLGFSFPALLLNNKTSEQYVGLEKWNMLKYIYKTRRAFGTIGKYSPRHTIYCNGVVRLCLTNHSFNQCWPFPHLLQPSFSNMSIFFRGEIWSKGDGVD